MKQIPGFPGYKITEDGKVWSDKRNKFLCPQTNKDGHLTVKLQLNKKSYVTFVHRLVALTYIPNPENLPCVLHKQGIPSKNSVDDLYWGTQKDNIQDSIKHGTHRSLKNPPPPQPGTKNRSAKLTEDQVRQIRASNLTISQLAKQYNMSLCAISSILIRRTWKHL